MPHWTIKSPVRANGQQVRVFGGKFVVAGIGPPGQTRRLYAELWDTSTPPCPARVATSHPAGTDTDVAGTRYWVVKFDIGSTPVAGRRFEIRLFVAVGNGRPRQVTQLSDLELRILTKSDGSGEVDKENRRAVNVMFPAPGTTHERFGFSPYGQVTDANEFVAAGGGSLGGGVTSNDGDTDGDGFWWVIFRVLDAGEMKTLTVSSNGTSPGTITGLKFE